MSKRERKSDSKSSFTSESDTETSSFDEASSYKSEDNPYLEKVKNLHNIKKDELTTADKEEHDIIIKMGETDFSCSKTT